MKALKNKFMCMNFRHIILIGLISVLANSVTKAQDASVSQFYALPHQFNPALYTLVENEFTISAIYQNRFASAVAGSYHLAGAQANIAIGVAKGDIVATNVSFLSDKMTNKGFQRNSFSIGLAYAKSLSNYQIQMVSIGVNANINQQKNGLAGLFWGNQVDGSSFNPGIPSGENFLNSNTNFDLNIGLQYFGDFDGKAILYGGVGVFHVVATNSSQLAGESYSNPIRINANLGTDITVSKLVSIGASFTFQKQAELFNLTPGLFVTLTLKESKDKDDVSISLGSYYRISDFIIPAFRLEAMGFSLGMAYDIALPSFNNNYNRFTGPEIYMSYSFDVFDSLNKSKGLNISRCPKF